MKREYRAVILEIDADRYRVDEQLLTEYLQSIGLAPVAVYDPADIRFCVDCRQLLAMPNRHQCGALVAQG